MAKTETLIAEQNKSFGTTITQQPQRANSPVDFTAPLITTGFDSSWGPSMGAWKEIPAGPIPRCPPGLEPLLTLDSVFVFQYLELVEIILNFETQNRYIIRDAKGANIFFAMEQSNCCCRCFCGPMREFKMHFYNAFQQQVMVAERPFRFTCGCLLQEMDIFVPPETMVATIQQETSCWKPTFSMYGKGRNKLLTVVSPVCRFGCFSDVSFSILDPLGNQIGEITKKWRGIVQEMATDADAYCVTFPAAMDVTLKASLLCMAMLIDYNFFEQK